MNIVQGAKHRADFLYDRSWYGVNCNIELQRFYEGGGYTIVNIGYVAWESWESWNEWWTSFMSISLPGTKRRSKDVENN